eukprot:CAMPEP_0184337188 /NCGR_PEP_ID=MMETSP1089-20130417/5549_1 /TAXON_ID=38269 ORGANISM="Gloeochaete wittrockiana, Strain SAG46.84" /NCGR_SAMPLE_ID=MMETSP1089 /ASSEMBLY_ACC=CAM_ASM_000445 /LENGTH=47 /DNA_ID= /DNA_START= /DNA_END= /DNA_ORIENTATION=
MFTIPVILAHSFSFCETDHDWENPFKTPSDVITASGISPYTNAQHLS